MTRRCITPFRPVAQLTLPLRHLRLGSSQNRVVLCLNRQRYEGERNACKERTHAEKHQNVIHHCHDTLPD